MQRTIKLMPADETAKFFNLFFGENPAKRYLFGINEYSEAIARSTQIDGFIDDFTQAKNWMGIPVFKLTSIDPDCLVISCITASYSVSALCKLQEAGIEQFTDYFSIADLSLGQLPQVHAIALTRKDYQEHADKYSAIRHLLHDELSRDIFDRLIDFRLNANLQAMSVFEYAADRQYFEPFLNLQSGEVFVDGGGFDGFTSQEFAKRSPEYSAIHLFEPSEKMVSIAKERLSHLPRVSFHPVGLYDRSATLCFDAEGGSASRISDTGTDTIKVVRLDDTVSDPVSFIKLDLEGAELAALHGAKNHILINHPKLAIAVYHQPEDFWKIPEFVLSVRDDYKLYLRHYTEGWSETVMFFIPT